MFCWLEREKGSRPQPERRPLISSGQRQHQESARRRGEASLSPQGISAGGFRARAGGRCSGLTSEPQELASVQNHGWGGEGRSMGGRGEKSQEGQAGASGTPVRSEAWPSVPSTPCPQVLSERSHHHLCGRQGGSLTLRQRDRNDHAVAGAHPEAVARDEQGRDAHKGEAQLASAWGEEGRWSVWPPLGALPALTPKPGAAPHPASC